MHKNEKGRTVRNCATSKATLTHQSYRTMRGSAYRPERLPHPAEYYAQQGMKLIGAGACKSTVCLFHDDTRLSLRVSVKTGGYCCVACGAHGDDVLAFHRQRYGLDADDAAKALSALEEK